MINVNKATRSELEIEILNDDQLMNYLGGINEIMKLNDEELREKVIDFVIEFSETM